MHTTVYMVMFTIDAHRSLLKLLLCPIKAHRQQISRYSFRSKCEKFMPKRVTTKYFPESWKSEKKITEHGEII